MASPAWFLDGNKMKAGSVKKANGKPRKAKLSRQRLWQIEMRKKGRCIYCGKPTHNPRGAHCLEHLIMQRERTRKKMGCVRRFRTCSSYTGKPLPVRQAA